MSESRSKHGGLNQAICLAIQNNNRQTLRLLLESAQDEDLIQKNNQGRTPIVAAAYLGNWGCVILIAQSNSRLATDIRAQYSWALFMGAHANQTQVVRVLLEVGTRDINYAYPTDGNAALHWAIHYENSEMLQLLMQSATDKNLSYQNKKTLTPIEMAAVRKNWNFVLIIAKAHKTDKKDTLHFGSALLTAAKFNHRGCVEGLLENEDRPSLTWSSKDNGYRVLHWAVEYDSVKLIEIIRPRATKDDYTAKNKDGLTPLELAVKLNRTNCVSALLEADKNTNVVTEKNHTQVLSTSADKILSTLKTEQKKAYPLKESIQSVLGGEWGVATQLAETYGRPSFLKKTAHGRALLFLFIATMTGLANKRTQLSEYDVTKTLQKKDTQSLESMKWFFHDCLIAKDHSNYLFNLKEQYPDVKNPIVLLLLCIQKALSDGCVPGFTFDDPGLQSTTQRIKQSVQTALREDAGYSEAEFNQFWMNAENEVVQINNAEQKQKVVAKPVTESQVSQASNVILFPAIPTDEMPQITSDQQADCRGKEHTDARKKEMQAVM